MSGYIEDNGWFEYTSYKSSSNGVWVSDVNVFSAPPRRSTEYIVPGRNGTVTICDGSFEDIEHSYTCFVKDNVVTNLQTLRSALLTQEGYGELTDSFHTDELYLAKIVEVIDVDSAPGGRGASVDVVFRRDARRFLKSAWTTAVDVSDGDDLTNPTGFVARPLIRITLGAGISSFDGTVSFSYTDANPISVTITKGTPYQYIEIDAETYEIIGIVPDRYNASQYVAITGNDFPVLSGNTTVTYSSNISSVKILTRWWRV